MQTLHAGADGQAVVVDGNTIAAVGPLPVLQEAHPQARVRRWPGVLGPGLAYEGALPEAPTPRERIHALLRHGVTAVLATPDDPADRAALERSGLARAAATALSPGGRADLAVFDADGTCVATVLGGRLVHRRA